MISIEPRSDMAAVQFMIMDIIEQTLANAENPVWLAQYLTEQIRSLIGGKIVVLLECKGGKAEQEQISSSPYYHRIISVCPLRYMKMVDNPELQQLAYLSHKIDKASIWSPADGEADVQEILRQKEWGVSVVIPLNLSHKRFGLLLVLNLLNIDRLQDTLEMLGMMPNVIALVLKNSLMYEELENMVQARTAELASKTEELAQRTEELTERTEELTAITEALENTNQKLENLNKELEDRVRKRTAELEAANRELITSNRELEAFCYSVSHDLRTPLRSIDGWSFALADEFEDVIGEDGKKYIERIRSETQHMGQLIDDLLKLSRITRSEMVIAPINLSKLAQTIFDRVSETYSKKEFEIIIQPELAAYGDIGMVDIVLTNLIENAFKFTSKTDKPKIEFGKASADVINSSGSKQIFFVKDNGSGFDMSHAAKLFKPFQRLHKISEFAGNGIGLAIVDRVIQRHGGRVWAEAKVNKGASFYFTL